MAINFAEIWSTFDWIIIVAYFVAIISVGLVMRKRASKNMKSFFVASRRLTIPVLVGVGAASWYDSWTIVGLAECGTTMGICMIFIYIIPTAILRLPLAVWIGPLVRNKIPDWVLTMPDLMAYILSLIHIWNRQGPSGQGIWRRMPHHRRCRQRRQRCDQRSDYADA